MDYYSILGVSKNASDTDIRKAYKKQSMKHHPDRGGDEEKFKQINEAYQTLGNAQKRAEYDNPPQQQFRFDTGGMGSHPFEDILNGFGFGGFNQRQHHRPKNRDIKIAYTIDIQDIYVGKNIIATYHLRSGKQESVEAFIPPGANHGSTIKISGQGDDADPRFPRGDLLISIRVNNKTKFKVNGADLHITEKINLLDFITSTEIIIDTPDQKTINLKVPKGTKPGTTFSIGGYGLPLVNTNRRGILFVKLEADVPIVTDQTIINKIMDLKNDIS